MHEYNNGGESTENLSKEVGIIEQTVGTFSFLQGNLQPSFAMLSLHSARCVDHRESGQQPRNEQRFGKHMPGGECEDHQAEVAVCLLPQQLVIYAWYGCLALFSIIVLCSFHLHRRCVGRSSPSSSLPFLRTHKASSRSRHAIGDLMREFLLLLALCLFLHLCCAFFLS